MEDKYKEFEWIRRIIRSCKTFAQLRTPITRLIALFTNKYQDMELMKLLSKERDNHQLYVECRKRTKEWNSKK